MPLRNIIILTSCQLISATGAIIMVIAIAVMILAPIAARLVYLAISRIREYLADASAAAFTRYP